MFYFFWRLRREIIKQLLLVFKDDFLVLTVTSKLRCDEKVDIIQFSMADESPHGAVDLKFIIAVRDVQQLEGALRNLRHLQVVLKAQRMTNGN